MFWALLLFAGQAALLALTQAGNIQRYQHLKLPETTWEWTAASILLAQTGLVAAAIWRRRDSLPLRGWRLWIWAALVGMISAAPSRDLRFYAGELAAAAMIAWAQAGNAWLAWREFSEERTRTWIPRLPVKAIALAVTCITALLSYYVYENHPHVADELAHVWQSRMYAQGVIRVPAPPAPEAFDTDLITKRPDGWYSPVPPGWPAVLALGFLIGMPWLINPLLAGANVLLASALFERLAGRESAHIAALLAAASPWNLFLGMSLMTHQFTFFCLLLTALLLLRFPLLSGLAAGAMFATRPLDALVAITVAGFAILKCARSWRRAGTLFSVGFLALAGAQLYYNEQITGSALKFPLDHYFDYTYRPGVNALGFGENRGLPWPTDPFPGHGLRDVLANGLLSLTLLNTELFGWPGGSLWLPLALALTRPWHKLHRWLFAAAALIPLAHTLYWFNGGPDFGPRYWFSLFAPLCLATALWMTPRMMLLSAFSLALFVPWRAFDKYLHYLDMRPDLRAIAWEPQGPALVFVRGRRHPDYASAAAYQPLDFRTGTVFVWERDAAIRAKVLPHYPGRRIWTVEGPTITGGGYRIIERP